MSKYLEYEEAMNIYHKNIFYNKSGLMVSICIMILQFITLINIKWSSDMISFNFLIYFIVAYLLTDLISGLVHMYMDNNTNYTSLFGPFIAAFHLHHKKPKYRDNNPISIYFFESGTKFWLIPYLLLVIYIQINYEIPHSCNFILVCIGILSSFSEVSHYLCHNSNNEFVKALQELYILLPPKHHRVHHIEDNKHYAFLNGVSDPVLNILAKYVYNGYKNNSDLHTQHYTGMLTENR